LIKWFFATSQQLDPKWEFPRSRLFIDEMLNEGEFGRVLRAHALDIGGVPGEYQLQHSAGNEPSW